MYSVMEPAVRKVIFDWLQNGSFFAAGDLNVNCALFPQTMTTPTTTTRLPTPPPGVKEEAAGSARTFLSLSPSSSYAKLAEKLS